MALFVNIYLLGVLLNTYFLKGIVFVARELGDKQLEKFGLKVITLSWLLWALIAIILMIGIIVGIIMIITRCNKD